MRSAGVKTTPCRPRPSGWASLLVTCCQPPPPASKPECSPNGWLSAMTRLRPAGSATTGALSRQYQVAAVGTFAAYRSLTCRSISTGRPVAAVTASLISSLCAQASGIALPDG